MSQLIENAKFYTSSNQSALLNDIVTIMERLQGDHITDYSFMVAPAAKAYEGYLKDFFLKLGIMTQKEYAGERFRVGKTLNPSLRYKKFSIFQKLSSIHEKGEELAEILWDAWKFGRNEIFHYFPHNLKKITRQEAEDRVNNILNAIIKSGKFLDDNDFFPSTTK